ncbi:hypothetical protein NEISUBOT_04970, partial [Neisseria subflava NJ9703]
YDKLGQITKRIAKYSPSTPHTISLSDNNSPTVPDNRLQTYNGSSYYYDDLGNLIHRELADGEVQNYFYDLHDQLVKAEIFKKRRYERNLGVQLRRLGQKDRQRSSENQSGSFRRPRRGNRIRLGRQPPLAGSPPGRQIYLYLYRSR